LVLPVKIFRIREKAELGLMSWKLKEFKESDEYQREDGQRTVLVKEILDLRMEDNSLSGIFSMDFMQKRSFRRQIIESPVTEEASFWIKQKNEEYYLIVLAPSVARGVKKLLTGHVANKISEILFIRIGGIINTRMPNNVLKELHESNPQATKLIWFDEVDIPGIDKLCLAGSDLTDTTLYREYTEHGKIWYVVFEVQKRGMVVGITRDCVITLFSRATLDEFIEYITEDILSLIQ
jgi:hypothetical protein